MPDKLNRFFVWLIFNSLLQLESYLVGPHSFKWGRQTLNESRSVQLQLSVDNDKLKTGKGCRWHADHSTASVTTPGRSLASYQNKSKDMNRDNLRGGGVGPLLLGTEVRKVTFLCAWGTGVLERGRGLSSHRGRRWRVRRSWLLSARHV